MANGKAQTENKEWDLFIAKVAEINKVFGSLLFIPVILIVGIAYGIRAGLIAGIEKTLEMLKFWGT